MTTFRLNGNLIALNDDIKKYYATLNDFKYFSEQVSNGISKILDKGLDVNAALEAFTELSRNKIEKIIKELSDFNNHNLVIEDFLLLNSGYVELLQAVADYYTFTGELHELHRNTLDATLDDAREYSSNQITGLDFNIYSSSVLSHLVYHSMNESKVARQTQQARQLYEKMSRDITLHANNILCDATKSYIKNEFKPRFLGSISSFCVELHASFIMELSKCGQFDISCLNGIDLNRSCLLLKNTKIVESKMNVIEQAIRLCPYNLEAYASAIDYGMFTPEMSSLVIYFGIDADLISRLEKSNNLGRIGSMKVEKALQEFWSVFETISVIQDIPLLVVIRRYFENRAKAIISKLVQMDKALDSEEAFWLYAKDRQRWRKSLSEKESFDRLFDDETSASEIEHLRNYCGFDQIFGEISDKLKWGSSNLNYTELVAHFWKKVKRISESYLSRISSKEQQESLEAAKVAEQQRKIDEKRAARRNTIYIAMLILSLCLVLYGKKQQICYDNLYDEAARIVDIKRPNFEPAFDYTASEIREKAIKAQIVSMTDFKVNKAPTVWPFYTISACCACFSVFQLVKYIKKAQRK